MKFGKGFEDLPHRLRRIDKTVPTQFSGFVHAKYRQLPLDSNQIGGLQGRKLTLQTRTRKGYMRIEVSQIAPRHQQMGCCEAGVLPSASSRHEEHRVRLPNQPSQMTSAFCPEVHIYKVIVRKCLITARWTKHRKGPHPRGISGISMSAYVPSKLGGCQSSPYQLARCGQNFAQVNSEPSDTLKD